MGIQEMNIDEFRESVAGYNHDYVGNWNDWINNQNPEMFGSTLRIWKACRPNKMRRPEAEAVGEDFHEAPFLEDLMDNAKPHIEHLINNFNLEDLNTYNDGNKKALKELWDIFLHLSHRGKANNGLASEVGISKAVIILSNGVVGPAFDSNVRRNLGFGNQRIKKSEEWISALKIVTEDIIAFKEKNRLIFLNEACPHVNEKAGRLYDMALGPR